MANTKRNDGNSIWLWPGKTPMTIEVPNLVLLRHFVAIAEEGGITRAARRLRISQPALSKSLHRLEHILGVPLFVRHAGGAVLTEAGQRFLDHARNIGLEYEHAVQEINNLITKQEGAIRLGVGPVWASTIIPLAIPRFHRRFPRHQLQIRTGDVEHMIEDLRLGRIDIFAGALLRQNRFAGFTQQRHAQAELGLMCSGTHPLALSGEKLDLKKLSDYNFVSYIGTSDVMAGLNAYLQEHGLPPPRNMVVMSSIYACVELTKNENYLFFESLMLTKSRIGEGLKTLELPGFNSRFDMGFVYPEGLGNLPPYKGIISAMIDTFDAIFVA